MKKQLMKWINSLKIAVIEENITAIGKLMQSMPQISDLQEAQESLALISQAISLVEREQTKALDAMKKIKQTKAFLESH
jgi:hypothetical protein